MENSLSTEVYMKLMDKLIKKELIPGDLINRRQIADELQVSVTPVLEAMLQLESEGFLESIPRKGTRICLIREEDIRGQLIVREALECRAARMYCGNTIIQNEKELMEMAKQADHYLTGSLENWKSEVNFHKSLMQLTNCPALIREFERVARMQLFYGINSMMSIDKASIREKHELLIKELQAEDPDQAEKSMRKHLRSGREKLKL